MTRLLLLIFCLAAALLHAQDEALHKSSLLLERCSYEPNAELQIIKDEGTLAVNNDYSLRLDRKVLLKFYKDRKLDNTLAAALFYQSPSMDRYYKLKINQLELDPITKVVVVRDVTTRFTTLNLSLLNIKVKKGSLLEISYSINQATDEKIPDWRFQSYFPVEQSSMRLRIPETVELRETLESTIDLETKSYDYKPESIRLNNKQQTLKVSNKYYQINLLSSISREPFADYSPAHLARLKFHLESYTIDGKVYDQLQEKQAQKIIEALSTNSNFLLKLAPSFDLKSDWDKRIKSISNPEEKVARIYDLVRRHLTWNKEDTLLAHYPLAKVWADRKGNATEINLILIKLLQQYGFEADPVITATRSSAMIDTNDVSIDDFNRTIACVQLAKRRIYLDATSHYLDYPMLPAAVLNTWGLLISMDRDRWVHIMDTATHYRHAVTLLGSLMGDSLFKTNIYINNTGYAKAEHLSILDIDSLRGLRKYFERSNRGMSIHHFIVANEYVDTLPLAQEFDIKVVPEKTDNLYGVRPSYYALPDTLFTITDSRKSKVNFGYFQNYTLVSEFSYPSNYEVYLTPNNNAMSCLDGMVHFEREFHNGGTNFSLRQSLHIDKSELTVIEAVELAKFLKKVNAMNQQKVLLKRLH